jgi:hypothetical protein
MWKNFSRVLFGLVESQILDVEDRYIFKIMIFRSQCSYVFNYGQLVYRTKRKISTRGCWYEVMVFVDISAVTSVGKVVGLWKNGSINTGHKTLNYRK